MREFKTYHPIVNFTYFAFVVTFSCVYMHPVCLVISLLSGFVYSLMTGGKKALKFNFLYLIPLFLLSAVINPLFNHAGVTVLAYFPNSNPLTLESVIYGIAAGGMIASVICHFESFNKIMTSDKFIYLFGRILPSMSLILSMTLRFVPRFKVRLLQVCDGQKCIGKGPDDGNILQRAKNAVRIMSIMITWALENALVTADSMKSRGYGLSGRTAYSDFVFDNRDLKALLYIIITGVYVVTGGINGCIKYSYFPSASKTEISVYSLSVFAAYFLLCVTPIIIEGFEAIRWNLLKQKI